MVKVVIIESMSVFSLLMMVRGAKPSAYHSLEGFQYVVVFQLFKVKLESCVFWLADSFQTKVEGPDQQVMIASNVYS